MPMQTQRGGRGRAISVPEAGVWLAPSPGHFTAGKDTVPTIRVAGWALWPVCVVPSPNRTVCSKSLHQLWYAGNRFRTYLNQPSRPEDGSNTFLETSEQIKDTTWCENPSDSHHLNKIYHETVNSSSHWPVSTTVYENW